MPLISLLPKNVYTSKNKLKRSKCVTVNVNPNNHLVVEPFNKTMELWHIYEGCYLGFITLVRGHYLKIQMYSLQKKLFYAFSYTQYLSLELKYPMMVWTHQLSRCESSILLSVFWFTSLSVEFRYAQSVGVSTFSSSFQSILHGRFENL
jgi:hypothetical protein